jgi:hypothetical protein
LAKIGAADFVAERQQDFGDAAHPGSTDTHQMDVLSFSEHRRTPQTRVRKTPVIVVSPIMPPVSRSPFIRR